MHNRRKMADDIEKQQRRAERRARRRNDPLSMLGGTLIALFAIGLIFSEGNAAVGSTLLGLVALLTALYFVSAQAQRGMTTLLTLPGFRRTFRLIIPVFAVAAIFTEGNPALMILVLVVAALALAAAMLTVRTGPSSVPDVEEMKPPAAVPALPVQSSGETISEIDIRALCRGLPPAVAGQVFATVEHLETAAAEAKLNGDTRRSYDARQGLTDYLPNTVNAWKAQPEDGRDLDELTRALEQVREIAGAGDSGGEAGRRAWETQQRFLAARKGEKG
ncbi:MFS transporter [Deinococcus saxicola]